MPTVPELSGYKLKFYSNENDEPAHVHVSKGDGNAKYWLLPEVTEAYSYGFTVRERRDIRKMTMSHSKMLINKWNEYFKENI